MTTLREMRLATGRSQRAFAALLGMPIETYRPFDSGRRAAGTALLDRAEQLLNQHLRDSDLFTLDSLAGEFDIHPRTLRAAARDGRLQVHLSTKSVFGKPLRLATRSAMDAFVRVHYRQRYSRFAPPVCPPPIVTIPSNYTSRLIGLRGRLRLTQAELACRIGAANKAVIYQWETHRRRPSPAGELKRLCRRTESGTSGDQQSDRFDSCVDARPGVPRQDGTPDVVEFAETLEKVCVDVVESGRMTKDLAILIREDHPYLTTDDFMKAIDVELRKRRAN